jgi:hypothetical protein
VVEVLKQRMLTTAMAFLALLVVFGGWFLTNGLLNREHIKLMNTVHSIKVKEPLAAQEAIETSNVTLSTVKIANILKVWGSGRRSRYHDPYEGQLTMEEAILAANSGLTYLCDQGVLPKGLLEKDFTRTNAFLYDVQEKKAAPVRVSPDPAYSFWSVSLINREVTIRLVLNALTGRIWMADLRSSTPGVNFDDQKAWAVLEAYEAYLGLSDGDVFWRDEGNALKVYGNNQFGINAYKRTGESGHDQYLHFSLNKAR